MSPVDTAHTTSTLTETLYRCYFQDIASKFSYPACIWRLRWVDLTGYRRQQKV